MNTSYDVIFDRFYKKLKNDKHFFNYGDLPIEEIEELVKDHSIDLLNQAIDIIYTIGKPDIDWYDKNDITMLFNVELVQQEIGLIVNLMYQSYFEEERNKLKKFGLTFKSSELNVFSPAEDRKSFLAMLDALQKDNENSIKNYLSRERTTWKFKSMY